MLRSSSLAKDVRTCSHDGKKCCKVRNAGMHVLKHGLTLSNIQDTDLGHTWCRLLVSSSISHFSGVIGLLSTSRIASLLPYSLRISFM